MQRFSIILLLLATAVLSSLVTGLYLRGGQTGPTAGSAQSDGADSAGARNVFKQIPDAVTGRLAAEAGEPDAGSGKKPSRGGSPTPYFGDLPSIALINIRNAVLDTVVEDLDSPWSMEFMSDSRLLIGEAEGKLKILELDGGRIVAVEGVPDIPSGKGQVGLMDVALHPDFDRNGLVYFAHAVRDPGEEEAYATAVTRAVLRDNALHDVQRIFQASPSSPKTANFGGALEFDDAGYLYISVGDRGQSQRAQDTRDLNGKIIRLHDDGSIPGDNPFIGNPDVDDAIYAYGVRNPQGLVFDRASGNLYETEHGPMGGDEVNIIRAGRNYGWSTISYGARYSTSLAGVGSDMAGMEQPLYYYLPSIAVSPLEIYRGAMFPEWEGHLLAGALKQMHVNKLDLSSGAVISEQRILGEMGGRVRDIKVADDGSIYFLLETGGRLMRLSRDTSSPDLEQPTVRSGREIYQLICASCHSAGTPGIPQLGARAEWEERLARGKQTLYQHTLEGYRGMPERGLCENCTDEELMTTVDFMLKRLKKKD